MILAVCLNLALDLTYRVASLRVGATNRVAGVFERAGGKAVNVARVLDALGHDVVIMGFAGGRVGEAVVAELDTAGLAHELVPIAGQTRRTLIVVEDGGGEPTGISEPGPCVSEDEWAAFVDAFRSRAPDASAVVLAGTLPPGLPAGAYATLISEAGDVPALLDTAGEPLRLGAAAGPAIVKVNRAEIAGPAAPGSGRPDDSGRPAGADHLGSGRPDDSGRPAGPAAPGSGRPDDPGWPAGPDDTAGPARGDEVVAAAERLRATGAVAVVVTLGEEGLVAVTAEGVLRAAAPETVAGNPIGAGDAASAALVAGMVAGTPWQERLADAAALSAASVHAPVAGSYDAAAYARYRAAAASR